MEGRSRRTSSVDGQEINNGKTSALLPEELENQVNAITKSSRIADGIKKVIQAITKELQALHEENVGLRRELDNLRSKMPHVELSRHHRVMLCRHKLRLIISDTSPMSSEADHQMETERLRSVVISGVPELKSHICRERISMTSRVSVVFPSHTFQWLTLKRPPRLRHYSSRGIYIRESLTLEQRRLRRDERIRNRRTNVVVESPSMNVDQTQETIDVEQNPNHVDHFHGGTEGKLITSPWHDCLSNSSGTKYDNIVDPVVNLNIPRFDQFCINCVLSNIR
ncbi:hypothetical protein COOONC_10824 [Cooperia oncophora]